MSRITTFYLILAIGILFLASCSGGKSDPVTPELKDQAAAAEEAKGSKLIGGIWHIVIDKDTGEFDILNMRNSELVLNVLGFMEPPVLSGVSIDLDSLVFNEPVIEVDVILSHPIPDTVFMGFDVRGVVFGPRIVNADGLTILTGPEYFKGEPFGYIDGLLGAPDSYAHYKGLAGYKYFCDGLHKKDDLVEFMSDPSNLEDRGLFGVAPNSNKRHYILDWEGSGLNFTVFNYAMYVNYDWPISSGPPTGVDDFDINLANSAEAFCCKVTEVENSLWYSGGLGGGTISLDVEAWDWQGNIESVTIESLGAGIDKTPYTIAAGQGSTDYSYLFSYVETPGTPTAAGEHEILITVTDPKTFGGYWFMDLLSPSNPMYNEKIFNCFLYTTTVTEAPPVEVYSISPDTGETSTYIEDIIVTGDYFSGPGAQVKLRMDSEPDIEAGDVVVMNISTITCDISIPLDATLGLYDVEVTTGDGIKGTGEELFEVYEILPIVTSIEPDTGETSMYYPDVTITGDNFEGPGLLVKLKMEPEPDLEATNVIVMSPTTVMCDIDIPYGVAAGLYDVEVTNGNGKSGVGASLFEIIDTSPVVASIDPDIAETGTDLFGVSVLGANFEGPGALVKLKLVDEPDIVATNVIVNDAFSISCDVSIPEFAAIGFYDIEVTNSDGKYGLRKGLFEVFTTNPIIIGSDPDSGEAGTDLVGVSIFGSNFEGPGAQVKLKMDMEPDIDATNVVVVDEHLITCDISIPFDAAIGYYDIEVTNGNGKSGVGEELFLVLGPPPEVTGIDPDSAEAGADLVGVTVYGANFVAPAQVILLAPPEPEIFAMSVVVVDVNTITCDISIPVESFLGLYDVEVRNGDGKTGIGEDLFEVLCPTPVITLIEPNHGNQGEPHTLVTITGEKFVGDIEDADVRLTKSGSTDIVGTIFAYEIDTITADFDLSTADLGAYDVEVTNGCGGLAIEPGGFTVE